MKLESGFDMQWEEPLVKIEAPALNKKQISIIEDEMDQFLRMTPEGEAAFNRLREDSHFRLMTGYPKPR